MPATSQSVFPRARAAAADRAEADPVRRRRAQLHGQGLGLRARGRRGPLGADVPRRLRGRAAQPGRADPLRGAQRARLDPRRAHLLGLARHGAGDARSTAIPQFTVDGHRPVGDFDLFGVSFSTELGYTNMLNALDLAGIPLHAVDRTDDDPIVHRRRPRRVQPRADRRLHRRRRARRRRGDRARDLRGRPRVEGRGPARRPRSSCCAGSPPARTSTSPSSTTSPTPPTARSRRSCPTSPASRSGSASTR